MYFSAEDKPAPTKEEIEQGRSDWGIKYDDECLKFEKEWKIISDRVNEEQAVFLESELGDLQKAKVEMLADKVLNLNMFELRYFEVYSSQKVQKSTGLNPMKMNMDWPSVK